MNRSIPCCLLAAVAFALFTAWSPVTAQPLDDPPAEVCATKVKTTVSEGQVTHKIVCDTENASCNSPQGGTDCDKTGAGTYSWCACPGGGGVPDCKTALNTDPTAAAVRCVKNGCTGACDADPGPATQLPNGNTISFTTCICL